MNFKLYAHCLFAATLTVLLSSCLTRRTVIRDGQVVESNYVFKGPFKDSVKNTR